MRRPLSSTLFGLVALLASGVGHAGLNLGAEARWRYEYVDHQDWGAESDGYLLQRYLIQADYAFEAPARAFVQLKSGLSSGQEQPRPTDRDHLDLHQAFVELSPEWRPVKTLRLGRQELAFGSGRLYSVRESPNVRRSFDGLRTTVASGAWSTEVFMAAPVETDPGAFDDGDERGQRVWGVYAVRPGLDLYYLGLRRDEASFEQGRAREERHSLGSRVWGAQGPWRYNLEVVIQAGSFGDGDIGAWTAASDSSHQWANARGRPRLGLKANLSSGDGDPDDADLQTFNPLFPRGNYFGEAALIGPLNHMDLHPFLELSAGKAVTLTADWDFLWRQRRSDGLYRSSGALLVPGNGRQERFVGHQAGLGATWTLSPQATAEVAYVHFFPGPFLKASGLG